MSSFPKFFNPEVTDLDFHITVSFRTAHESGWDFSEWIERDRDEAETFSEAQERILNEWSICVTIRGKKNCPNVTYCCVEPDGTHQHGQETGDARKTVEDVIQWLSEKSQEIVRDFSLECSGDTYQPAFAQFKTQD